MTKQVRYLCDYCGKSFEYDTDCVAHEAKHLVLNNIIKSFYNTDDVVPDKIFVRCNNGQVLEYEFSKRIQNSGF